MNIMNNFTNRMLCQTLMLLMLSGTLQQAFSQAMKSEGRIGIVIHGGAGTILPNVMTRELETQYREKLKEALLAGYTILKNNGSGLDAVESVIRILEDSPLFNAGKGAVFTHEGTIELDASLMDGRTLAAGSVSGLQHIKNPITLARLVMEHSPHVMMTGEGAEAFAKEHDVLFVDQKYFFTDKRWNQLQDALSRETIQSDSIGGKKLNALPSGTDDDRHGTVGCVVLDRAGNLAAGTSTGGMTNKRFGRIGDAPIIGAGTYANNSTCAVSATGDGEFFIRSVVGHDISALMEYKGLTVTQATEQVIVKVGKLGGTGGVIAIDREGNIAMPFNSDGMYRAYIDSTGEPVVKIYKE